MRLAGPVATTPRAESVLRPVAGPVATTPRAESVLRPVAGPVAATPQATPVVRPLFWGIPIPILSHQPADGVHPHATAVYLRTETSPDLHWYLPQFLRLQPM